MAALLADAKSRAGGDPRVRLGCDEPVLADALGDQCVEREPQSDILAVAEIRAGTAGNAAMSEFRLVGM
jgi:hypothetical protein